MQKYESGGEVEAEEARSVRACVTCALPMATWFPSVLISMRKAEAYKKRRITFVLDAGV